MAKTLADLKARTLIKLGLPSDDALVPAATLTQCINNGLTKMAMDYDWPHLYTQVTITTVAGTRLYGLPDGTPDPQWVRTIWISKDDVGVDLIQRQRRDLTIYSAASRGKPRWYAENGQAVLIAPTPDGVYSLTHVYIRTEPELVDDGDEPLCPEHMIDIVVCYAVSEASIFTKDTTIKNMADTEIQGWIKRMRDNVHMSASTMRIRVRQDW